MKRAALQAQARCAQRTEPKLSPHHSSASTRPAQRAPATATQQPAPTARPAPAGSAQSNQTAAAPFAPVPGVYGASTPASAAAAAALARVSATTNEQSTLPNTSLVAASLAQGASAEGRLPSAANSAAVRPKPRDPPGFGPASHGAGSSMPSPAAVTFSTALDTAHAGGASVSCFFPLKHCMLWTACQRLACAHHLRYLLSLPRGGAATWQHLDVSAPLRVGRAPP